jgi:hypothetical protein
MAPTGAQLARDEGKDLALGELYEARLVARVGQAGPRSRQSAAS